MAERIKRAELRGLLLDAGARLLRTHGVHVGLNAVSFPAVFAEVEAETGRRVTRGSVYDRIWDSLEGFQWDVLTLVIEEASAELMAVTSRRVREVLPQLEVTTEADRWHVIRLLCNVVVDRHVLDASRQQDRRIVAGTISAIASSDPDWPAEVAGTRATLAHHLDFEASWQMAIYRVIGRHAGFRMREPFELRHLALAVGALADGIATRLNVTAEYQQSLQRPDAEDGPDLTGLGTLASISVESLVRSMLELDPDWAGPLSGTDLETAFDEATLGAAAAAGAAGVD